MIYSPAITLFQFAIVLVIWAFLIIGLRKLKTKILVFRHFIDGTAVIVINRGKIDIAACKKAKITAHDLAFKLRKEGVYYIQNVKRAVLEQNGELIVVLAGEENPKYPIITDGIIHKGVLEDVDKTEEWLLEELHKQGYETVSEIFLAEYYGGQVKVVPYIFITLHLIEKRQKTFWGTLRTILLFPLAIVGDTCLVIAYLIALMVSNILEKYEN